MPTLLPLLKRLYNVLLLTLFFSFANAQTDINTSFSDRMNHIFQQLEKNRVPNGLLLDYAMEFTNLSNFNGTTLTDSNKVMTSEFWEMYNTLYLSRIHPNGFTIQNPSTFDSLWFSQREYGKIVLAGLFYNYSRFRDDAAQSNLITIQNDQVIDRYVSGVWQNPYQTEKLFAISPSIEFYEGKNMQVILPSNLWQTNAASEISNLSVDVNDGQGYRTMSIGQPLTLNYTDTGSKVWTYRLQLANGQYLYSHSQVRIKKAIVETGCTNCRFGNTNPETIPFTADEAFQGEAANGFITIRYRDADLGLRRPLIVVEGFDAGHITSPELQFGTSTILDFFDNVDDGTPFNTALENVITNFPEYDIVYVDWRNGTDLLQRNGLLLQTIIRWVNANKEPLPGGGFADNVILGQSMGGVITRWALRDMETRLGQQHHTRLFISMDAPQQGANVPVSYQHLARHMRSLYLQTNVWGGVELFQWVTGGTSPFRVLGLADRPASRQMLINWVNGSGTIDNTLHEQWQTELRNLGYPTQNNIRNIAISNGAECGTTQPFAPGAELLNVNGKANTRFLGDLLGQVAFPLSGVFLGQGGFYLGILPGRNDIKYEFIANAQPLQGAAQRIYRGKISFTKKILWLIPVTITITERNHNNNSSLLPYDYYGGGQINTGVNISDINIQNALVKFNMNFSHIPTFSFIPTPSALDIGFNNTTLNNADYLARYIGGAPPAAPKNTPFHNFVTAFNDQRRNEQHIGFFQRNGDWTAQELAQTGNPPPNAPVADCSAFCENGIITGIQTFCYSETFSAPFGNGIAYNWSVSDPTLVTLNPMGNSVVVTRIGTESGQATLTVNMTGACGSTTLSLPIYVGVPDRPMVFDENGQQVTTVSTCTYVHKQLCPQTDPKWDILEWEWEKVTGNFNLIDFESCAQVLGFQPGSGFVSVRVRNACGWSQPTFMVVHVTDCSSRKVQQKPIKLFPNPATSTVTLSVDKPKANQSDTRGQENVPAASINDVKIYDNFGSVKLYRKFTRQQTASLDVSGLPTGIYTVEVNTGGGLEYQQLLIQK